MAQAQLTNLTWKLGPDNLRRMLHDMRGRSDFTDVTLVCDDDTLVEAHKVVLGPSARSSGRCCPPTICCILDPIP